MSERSSFRRLFRLASTRGTVAHEVDDEVRFHLDQRVDDLVAQGHTRDAARETALREFGDLSAARAELTAIDRRRVSQGAWREWRASLWQDVRFAVRSLVRRPGFAATMVLTLALGIGANAAIFSVVNAVLLKPLPFAQPDRLVHLWEVYQSRVDNKSEASYPDYLDWRARNRVFTDLAGYQGSGLFVGKEHPTLVYGGKVTSNVFDVLGLRPYLGRFFAPGEDAPGAPRVAVVGYAFWQRELGGDRSIVGRAITVNDEPFTVIGVLPEKFLSFNTVGGSDLWLPLDRDQHGREQRGNHWLNVIARLRDGVTVGAASANMSQVMHDLAREYPESNAGRDAQVVTLREQFDGPDRPIILLIYAAVAVMLLVACANVANLLLMRGADRHRELAVRAAMGAGRPRLVRQLMTESLLVALAGGAAGLLVGRLGLTALVGIIPADQRSPQLRSAGIGGAVLVYSIVITMLAGMLFGVLPALRASRAETHDALRQGARGSARSGRLRDGLVVAEAALTIVLMAGAALLGRSLANLFALRLGFDPAGVTTAGIYLPEANYPDPAVRARVYDRIARQTAALPGVRSAALITKLPLQFSNSVGFTVAGQPEPAAGKEPTASYRSASPGYFGTMDIPLTRGRDFGAGDDAKAPHVGIVNRALADAYFPGGAAIGQTIVTGGPDSIRIVGIVGDVPIGNVNEPAPPTLYQPLAQDPDNYYAIAVRSQLPRAEVVRLVERTVAGLAPEAAVIRPLSMNELILRSGSVFLRRFPLLLVGAFALITLVLALVGISGVVSYSVAQRTREIGIRMALGAQQRGVVLLVMRHGVGIALVGAALGLLASLFLGHLVQGLLYGVTTHDPTTFVLVSAVLAAAAACATIVPARRATRVDPAIALRAE